MARDNAPDHTGPNLDSATKASAHARQCPDDRPDGRVDLAVGQGAIHGIERQANRKALLVGGERGTTIDVEQAHVVDVLTALEPDEVEHGRGGDVVADDDRQVALHGLESTDDRSALGGEATTAQTGQGHLRGDDPVARAELPGVRDARVQLAHDRLERGPGPAFRRRGAVRPGWNDGSSPMAT